MPREIPSDPDPAYWAVATYWPDFCLRWAAPQCSGVRVNGAALRSAHSACRGALRFSVALITGNRHGVFRFGANALIGGLSLGSNPVNGSAWRWASPGLGLAGFGRAGPTKARTSRSRYMPCIEKRLVRIHVSAIQRVITMATPNKD